MQFGPVVSQPRVPLRALTTRRRVLRKLWRTRYLKSVPQEGQTFKRVP